MLILDTVKSKQPHTIYSQHEHRYDCVISTDKYQTGLTTAAFATISTSFQCCAVIVLIA